MVVGLCVFFFFFCSLRNTLVINGWKYVSFTKVVLFSGSSVTFKSVVVVFIVFVSLFAAIDLDNFVLVDVLEDVRSVH